MSTSTQRVQRFLVSDRVLHILLLISFTVLAVTGLPQMFADTSIGVGIIQLMGGIEQTRVFHHTAAVVLILTSIAHAVQIGYRVFVLRGSLDMLPTLKDLTDFVDAVKYNLGLSKQHPHYPRYNFIEKMEYWAVVWGTVLMTLTGYVLWNPVLVTQFLPGEVVPTAKFVHGLEAILAVLSILTWHAYFVHVAMFNRSMFTGYLSHEQMEEEHAAELQRIRENRERPLPSPEVRWKRLRVYAPLAMVFFIASVVGTWWWLTAETTAITTVPRIAAVDEPYQPVPLEPLPLAAEREPLPTPPAVLEVVEQAPPPSIPHEIDEARAQCTLCHGVDSLIRPAPLSHQDFSEDQCLTCHQSQAPGSGGGE